jgi:hypothetical protein
MHEILALVLGLKLQSELLKSPVEIQSAVSYLTVIKYEETRYADVSHQ